FQFEDVNYWKELVEIMEWSKERVTSMLHICWGAQAALYHHYGIDKFELPKKCSGIYQHKVHDPTLKIVPGFGGGRCAPHARYTANAIDEIERHTDLTGGATSDDAGLFLVKSEDDQHIMVTGHVEYDATTVRDEYERDIAKGLKV